MLLTDLNEVGFFEGTEKLLEIWFVGKSDDSNGDLRYIPRKELDNLLLIVDAKIISSTSNESIDAYVLSESSMFVSKNRLILKTCGITKLLDAVEPIIMLAKKYSGLEHIENFFYSRRIYLRPDEQRGQHKSFSDEAKFLNKIFVEGSAYVLGKEKGEEWYLYTLDQISRGELSSGDVTLEVLMSDLDENIMCQFTSEKFKNSQELAQSTGISAIIPGSIHDGQVFDPIGYSMNGLFKDSYHTIHVTPQPMCSYVSFETNLPLKDYTSLINRVLNVFKPNKFIITVMSNEHAPCGMAWSAVDHLNLDGYNWVDQQNHLLKNYSVAYEHYVRS